MHQEFLETSEATFAAIRSHTMEYLGRTFISSLRNIDGILITSTTARSVG